MRKIPVGWGLVFVLNIFCQLAVFASPAIYDQAVDEYNAGRYAKALSKFESCKAVEPNNLLVRYYEALCLQNLASFETAKAEYQWVAIHSNDRLRSMALSGLHQLSHRRAHADSMGGARSYAAAVYPTVVQTKSKVSTVLDFYADWCGPCKAFAPVFGQVKNSMQGIIFQSYNVDDEDARALQVKYQFTSIPHAVFLDASGKVLFNGSPARDVESFKGQIAQFR
jgi:thiol-disulfide isomerase/thioredoxin